MRKKYEYRQISVKVSKLQPSTIIFIHRGDNIDDNRNWLNVRSHFWSINQILDVYGEVGWVLRNQDSSPPDKNGHIILRYTFGRIKEE